MFAPLDRQINKHPRGSCSCRIALSAWRPPADLIFRHDHLDKKTSGVARPCGWQLWYFSIWFLFFGIHEPYERSTRSRRYLYKPLTLRKRHKYKPTYRGTSQSVSWSFGAWWHFKLASMDRFERKPATDSAKTTYFKRFFWDLCGISCVGVLPGFARQPS